MHRILLATISMLLMSGATAMAQTRPATAPARRVFVPEIDFRNGKLTYLTDQRGNRVVDFSHAGYMGGGVAIPDAPVRVTVPPMNGDATPRIQAAIDYVSTLPPDANGIRGAVLLGKGRYSIATALKIRASGVIVRGQGQGDDGTVLVAAGIDRRNLIQINGRPDKSISGTREIIDEFVPVNASVVHVTKTDGLHVGDSVEIRRPSTGKWIDYIGTFQNAGRPDSGDNRSWRPGKFDLFWHRVITKIDGNAVTLDAPLTSTLDRQYTTATLSICRWPGLITQVGIENLRCDSEFSATNPLDEEHSWIAIGMECVRDSWVRNVTSRHFASSCVSLLETAERSSVCDCESIEPVSEVGGYRRIAFYTAGQQSLFLRCKSEHGKHDFAAGYEATGPSAFVQCSATGSTDSSGTIESWSSGFLFDCVDIRDHSIKVDNLAGWNQGAGWSGANCMIWNCQAPVITLRTPPGEKNWAYGCWGRYDGEGPWGIVNEWVDPDSLYMQQVLERLGKVAVATTAKRTIPASAVNAKSIDEVAPQLVEKLAHPPAPVLHPLVARNGWLTVDDKLLVGTEIAASWWQGHPDPQRAPDFGPTITRFSPGRSGPGVTDDLDQLTDEMLRKGQAAFVQNWGLWYDMRRIDHQQVRRIDANVEPPFFEQAWARAGQGVAWDGLSKYDLTKFNPWYFGRLRQFSDLCAQKGLLLINEMFFQHHLLEDAAHWVDTPWRVTNSLQDLGLPEPPPIENRKRITIANIYYDVTQPKLREFHRAFIRHQLDNFVGSPNVIFTTGEEFNGPLTFMQFWIDTIGEWEKETGNHPIIGLCCTKDVQDAILEDPVRSKVVDVIYMKNWWYTSNGGMYNPPGGEQVAPRKQGSVGGPGNNGNQPRQIRDYRGKYPEKAIVLSYSAGRDPWAAVMAGASMLRFSTDPKVMAVIPRMLPYESAEIAPGQWALAEKDQNYLVYSPTSGSVEIDLSKTSGDFSVNWINPQTNEMTSGEAIAGGAMREFKSPIGDRCVLWLSRK